MDIKIPILTYHYFGRDQSAQPGIKAEDCTFITTRSKFEQHLRYLSDQGFTAITLPTLAFGLIDRSSLPAKPIILTIDDGHQSTLEYAAPLLGEHNCPAELFLITDRVGCPGYLSWPQLRELSEQGLSLQSHGKSHTLLNKQTVLEREAELKESRTIIEEKSGRSVTAFAVPMGGYPAGLRRLLEAAGYDFCCTSYHGLNGINSDPLAMRRIMVKSPYESVAGLKSLMEPFSLPSVSRHAKNAYKYARNIL